MNRNILQLFIIGLLFLLASCDPYQKVLKSPDLEFKYAKAMEYYNKGSYDKAIPLFEELISVYKGTRSLEDLYYYYSYSHYAQDNFLISAYHFKNLYTAFPQGKYAEESLYMTAFSHYRMSPRVELDQTSTVKSIETFQQFANTFPNSERMTQVNKYMDDMRRKLEVKAFKAAEQYFNMDNYQAAAVAFENYIREHPASREVEQAHLYVIRSYLQWANHSVEARKAERYALAVNAFSIFSDRYPQSRYLREAEQLKETAQRNFQRFTTNSDS